MRSELGMRAALGMLDQAVLSAANFIFASIVARAVVPDEFGAFAVALSIYWITLGISRALTSEPLIVAHGAATAAVVRVEAGRAAATTIAVGGAAAAGAALVAIAVGGRIGAYMLPLAFGVPAALLQDYCRFVAYLQRRQRAVLLVDAGWSALLVIGALLIQQSGETTGSGFMAVWSACAVVAASLGVAILHVRPVFGQALAWVRENWRLAWRFVIEFSAFNGSSQAALYVIAGLGGLVAAGSIRGGQVLLGPFNVAFLGAGMVLLPASVTLLAQRGPDSLERVVRLIAAALALGAVIVGGAIFALPQSVGIAVLGSSWPGADHVVLPLAIALAASGASRGPIIGLRALKAAERSLRVRILMAPITVVLAAAGALSGGAFGGAVGLAVAAWLGALLAWREFRAGVSDLRGRSVPRTAERKREPVSAVSP